MNYLIKFEENGRRGETYLVENENQVKLLLADGFEIIPEEDYQLLLGNVDGKEHIRNADGSYSEYVPPALSLDKLKAQKINEFKNIRDTQELAPINNFDADEKSIMRINNAIIVLDITKQSVEWTLADNTTQDVTADDLRNVILAIGARSNELHEKYRLLKEQVEACTTKEELEEIQWGE